MNDVSIWTAIVTAVVGIAAVVALAEKFAVRCPKCGSHMVWNTMGYDKWECHNCGHSHR